MGKPPAMPAPRELNFIAAARYMGVNPGTFRKSVRLGIAPQPSNLPNANPKIVDQLQVDSMSARVVRHGGA
jgi:hypothetical protein